MPEFLEYPIKCRADWDQLKAERLLPETPGRIRQDWAAFRARLAETGEAVQVGDFPWGIRYIPGFDHLIPPDASWDNFQYAANQIKEVCYQS